LLPTVVQFGAGNIGRGFTGQLFTEAGYEVVFVDVAAAVVAALNERRSYPLRLAGPDRFETLTIRPVRAIDGRDVPAVARELARCAFACTAVGVPALPHVAPALAAGIRERAAPLNVILCENQLHCSDLLRGYLQRSVPEVLLRDVGLVESVVSRMAPVVPQAEREEDPLLAVAEDYATLPVDRKGFVSAPPPLATLLPVDDFAAYVERKLFVHNMGHAVAAYLGYQEGCEYVHQAMATAAVAAAVERAMAEAGQALQRGRGFGAEETRRHRDDLLRRFANPALNDTVARVGRDPVRKLRPEDRLVGAGLLCLDWDVEPTQIARGVAAALRFDPEDDPGAQAVQASIREKGLGQAFLELTGQRLDGELGRRVLAAWDEMESGRGGR